MPAAHARGSERLAARFLAAPAVLATAWMVGLAVFLLGTRLLHGSWPQPGVHWPHEERAAVPAEHSTLGRLGFGLWVGLVVLVPLALMGCLAGAWAPRTRRTLALGVVLAVFTAVALVAANAFALDGWAD